jgi:hypothetical protein
MFNLIQSMIKCKISMNNRRGELASNTSMNVLKIFNTLIHVTIMTTPTQLVFGNNNVKYMSIFSYK